MSAERLLHRSYLYAPGTRPELMDKALASAADAVILDLEDAVPTGAKAEARLAVTAALEARSASPAGPEIHVRINATPDGYDSDDLRACVRPVLAAIRLPKVEEAQDVAVVAAELDELEQQQGIEPGRIGLYLTVESARGVQAIGEALLASPRVVRAALGTSDLLADLGARGDEELATLMIRSQLVLTSRLVGVGPPIDSVHTQLDDAEGLVAAARRARSLGFHGKSVIHPAQLAIVHDVFTPDDDELRWARSVLEAYADAVDRGQGALQIDGRFIDAAIVSRARAVLALRRSK